MFKASLDRGQAPDFEIKLSVVSSKFIRDEPEIRLAQLASSARASCYAWTEAFISLCPEKWMTWWRACCLASVVPQFGSTGMGFTGFATWWGTESQAAELSKTLRPQSISKCPHHPHPFCGTELQTTRNPKQVRRWNAVCKQWILSVVVSLIISRCYHSWFGNLPLIQWLFEKALVCMAYWQMGISSHSPFCTIPYTISEFGRSWLVCIRLGLIWMNMFHTPDTRPPWI